MDENILQFQDLERGCNYISISLKNFSQKFNYWLVFHHIAVSVEHSYIKRQSVWMVIISGLPEARRSYML